MVQDKSGILFFPVRFGYALFGNRLRRVTRVVSEHVDERDRE